MRCCGGWGAIIFIVVMDDFVAIVEVGDTGNRVSGAFPTREDDRGIEIDIQNFSVALDFSSLLGR